MPDKQQRDEFMEVVEKYLSSKNGDEVYQLKNVLKQLESINDCVSQINKGLQTLIYAPGGIASSALCADFQVGNSIQSHFKSVQMNGDIENDEEDEGKDIEDGEDREEGGKEGEEEEWAVRL